MRMQMSANVATDIYLKLFLPAPLDNFRRMIFLLYSRQILSRRASGRIDDCKQEHCFLQLNYRHVLPPACSTQRPENVFGDFSCCCALDCCSPEFARLGSFLVYARPQLSLLHNVFYLLTFFTYTAHNPTSFPRPISFLSSKPQPM